MQHLLLLMLILPGIASAVEKLPYSVLDYPGEIELRQYPAHNLAVTQVKGGFKAAGSEGFRRLVTYIFGSNAGDRKIAMTAPIMQSAVAADQYQLSLFMPSQIALGELPDTADNRVKIIRAPASTMAVLAYKGGWAEKKYLKYERALLSALRRTPALKIVGNPIWARYNSPIVPGFLRSNEVLVPVSRIND